MEGLDVDDGVLDDGVGDGDDGERRAWEGALSRRLGRPQGRGRSSSHCGDDLLGRLRVSGVGPMGPASFGLEGLPTPGKNW